jgi:tetratricopeptide (TPR) repeat protein
MEYMEYEEIIQGIIRRLTGDSEKDLKILFEETQKYQGHKYSQEIIRAIGRIVIEKLPEDVRKELNAAIAKDLATMQLSTKIMLAEAKLQINASDLVSAEKILQVILSKLSLDSMYTEDQASAYFSFNNLLEEVYYKSKFCPIKKIRQRADFNPEVFLTYAFLLIEKREFGRAQEVLDQGLEYNPLDTSLLFEKAEISKIKKDWKSFKELTDLCFEYSYRPKDIARAYRNYGYMLIELEDYEGAICCYLKSLQYESHTMAQSQLYYISQLIDEKITPREYGDRINHVLKKNNVPTRPNVKILQIAFEMGKLFEEAGDYGESIFFYNVIYELTRDEAIREKLEFLIMELKKLKN